MAEHMLDALLKRLNEVKEEYAEKPGALTRKYIAEQIFAVTKSYAIDRREILYLFGFSELSAQDFQAMKELDYE